MKTDLQTVSPAACKPELGRPAGATDPGSPLAQVTNAALPSGRHVVVSVAGGQEQLEVRAPGGEVEVRVTLTDEGPVVHLRAAKLELEAVDTMSLACKTLQVRAAEGATVESGGDLAIKAKKEMWLTAEDDLVARGEIIHLN